MVQTITWSERSWSDRRPPKKDASAPPGRSGTETKLGEELPQLANGVRQRELFLSDLA